MKASVFKEFEKEHSNYLYCEELGIRIVHMDYANLSASYEPQDRGKLYKVQKHFNSPKFINCYMTKHMILKAYKKNEFVIKQFQNGGI